MLAPFSIIDTFNYSFIIYIVSLIRETNASISFTPKGIRLMNVSRSELHASIEKYVDSEEWATRTLSFLAPLFEIIRTGFALARDPRTYADSLTITLWRMYRQRLPIVFVSLAEMRESVTADPSAVPAVLRDACVLHDDRREAVRETDATDATASAESLDTILIGNIVTYLSDQLLDSYGFLRDIPHPKYPECSLAYFVTQPFRHFVMLALDMGKDRNKQGLLEIGELLQTARCLLPIGRSGNGLSWVVLAG